MRNAAAPVLSAIVLLALCLGQVATVTTSGAIENGPVRALNGTDATTTETAPAATPTETSTDSDSDGLRDNRERETFETDPSEPDTDSDGLEDGEEVHQYQTNPNAADTDGDGLADGQEIELGTDPIRIDTDGDGVRDAEEVSAGTDPTDENSFPTDTPRRSPTGNASAENSAETGLQGTMAGNAFPILTFIGGLVTAVVLLKTVRFYRCTRSPVVVRLDDDEP